MGFTDDLVIQGACCSFGGAEADNEQRECSTFPSLLSVTDFLLVTNSLLIYN